MNPISASAFDLPTRVLEGAAAKIETERRVARLKSSAELVRAIEAAVRFCEKPPTVMAQAEPVIRAALPDANVPTSVRSTGVAVHYGSVSELGSILDRWLDTQPDGIACVIGEFETRTGPAQGSCRVRRLRPELSKGLEFDLVILLDPESCDGTAGAVDRQPPSAVSSDGSSRSCIYRGTTVTTHRMPGAWLSFASAVIRAQSSDSASATYPAS